MTSLCSKVIKQKICNGKCGDFLKYIFYVHRTVISYILKIKNKRAERFVTGFFFKFIFYNVATLAVRKYARDKKQTNFVTKLEC